MDINQPTPNQTKLQITPEMMKAFKTLMCDCGGMIFQTALVLKKVSPLIAPSGKEELTPIEVLVCKNCGKVPNELNMHGILPEQVLAEKPVEEPIKEQPKKVKKGLTIVK
jgi:hypothetical protein